MNTGTVVFTSVPNPAAGFTASWNTEGNIVTFSHGADFIKDNPYTVRVASGKDLDGYDLVNSDSMPNPWTFRTVGDEPVIASTDPVDEETGVKLNQPIVIKFSEAMSTATVNYILTSGVSDPGGWIPTWSDGDSTLTLEHDEFEPYTKYQFEITSGQDLSAELLIPGSVANPFEFTTGEGVVVKDFVTSLASPATGATVSSAKPTLSWDATDNATSYKVYLSTDKSMVDSLDDSALVDEITGTSYTPSDDLAAETVYYWTIVPSDGINDGTSDDTRSFTTPKKGEKKDDKEDDMTWLWILIIIIVIVVVVLVVVLVLKKKEPEPMPEEPREQVIPPAEEAGPLAEGEMPPPAEEMAAIPPPEAAPAVAAAPAAQLEQYEAPPAEEPVAPEAAPAAEPAAPAAPAAEEPVAPAAEQPPAQPEGEAAPPAEGEQPPAEGTEQPPAAEEGTEAAAPAAVCPVCSAAITAGQTECSVCGASITG
jgi:cytoskeletal protein RodZ